MSVNILEKWLKDLLGIDKRDRELREIRRTQELIMATLEDVSKAIEESGLATIAVVKQESEQVVEALRQAAQNPSSANFEEIIQMVRSSAAKVNEAVSGIIPSVESPETPSDPNVPIVPPTPVPLPEIFSETDVPLVIVPSPEGVGVDGGSSIDIEE